MYTQTNLLPDLLFLSASAYEQAVEEQKHRLEMSQVRREMEKVMENFEKSQEVSAIVDRKRKRGDELQQVSWSNGEKNSDFHMFPSLLPADNETIQTEEMCESSSLFSPSVILWISSHHLLFCCWL